MYVVMDFDAKQSVSGKDNVFKKKVATKDATKGRVDHRWRILLVQGDTTELK